MSSLLMEAVHPGQSREPSGPPSRTLEVDIGGVPTKLMASGYSNRIFVVVTQRDNFGTLIQATRDDAVEASGPGCYSTRVLLGRRDDEALEVYARTLVELIHKTRPTELLLAINLVESTPAVFREVMQHLDSIKVW